MKESQWCGDGNGGGGGGGDKGIHFHTWERLPRATQLCQ
jgi:hypothetical protein